MTINKNTITFTADEFKGIILSFANVLDAHIDLIQRLADEEKLRRNHRSCLEARANIFECISGNEKMIGDACDLVDKYLNYCEICSSFEPGSEVSIEKHQNLSDDVSYPCKINKCDYCENREECEQAKIHESAEKDDKKSKILSKESSLVKILSIVEEAAIAVLNELDSNDIPF